MIKKIIAGLFFLMTGVILVSAQTTGLGKSDPDAKKILDDVSTKFKTFKSVQAKFTLKIENSAGKSIGTKTGTVYMKGVKYRINVTGQEIYCDGTNVSTYDQSTNEVTITKLDPTANTLTPQKIFTDFYDKDFLYKLNGESKSGIKTLQEIELTPIDKTKPFFKVIVYVDKLAKTINSVKVFEKTGNHITYSVSSFNSKAVISDDQFTFDTKKYPGAEVVDLR
jgi:outer membrane lipoprotein carrier protein